jgi:hypothetical protein
VLAVFLNCKLASGKDYGVLVCIVLVVEEAGANLREKQHDREEAA